MNSRAIVLGIFLLQLVLLGNLLASSINNGSPKESCYKIKETAMNIMTEKVKNISELIQRIHTEQFNNLPKEYQQNNCAKPDQLFIFPDFFTLSREFRIHSLLEVLHSLVQEHIMEGTLPKRLQPNGYLNILTNFQHSTEIIIKSIKKTCGKETENRTLMNYSGNVIKKLPTGCSITNQSTREIVLAVHNLYNMKSLLHAFKKETCNAVNYYGKGRNALSKIVGGLQYLLRNVTKVKTYISTNLKSPLKDCQNTITAYENLSKNTLVKMTKYNQFGRRIQVLIASLQLFYVRVLKEDQSLKDIFCKQNPLCNLHSVITTLFSKRRRRRSVVNLSVATRLFEELDLSISNSILQLESNQEKLNKRQKPFSLPVLHQVLQVCKGDDKDELFYNMNLLEVIVQNAIGEFKGKLSYVY